MADPRVQYLLEKEIPAWEDARVIHGDTSSACVDAAKA